MHRRILFVGLIALCSMAATGCHIYVDEDDGGDDGGYSYCNDTGCYWCDRDGYCYPDGGGGGTGWDCDDNYDCAAGCYCDPETDTCQEGGYCSTDSDCPEGFECDDRSSCVPAAPDEEECTSDADCEPGTFCDETSGRCVDSSTCTSDDECPEGQICDEERGTCIPEPCDENSDCPTGSYCDQNSGQCVPSSVCGEDGECPDGTECDPDTNTCVPSLPDPITCQGEVTCDEAPPTCEEGFNPGIRNGCYTGTCIADAECPDGAPVYCSDHATEEVCSADATCEVVLRGINCTDPTPDDGTLCSDPTDDCECERYVFDECREIEETPQP